MENKFIKPLTIGEWLDAAIKILWNNLKLYIGIAVLTFLTVVLLNFFQVVIKSPDFFSISNILNIVGIIAFFLLFLIVYIAAYIITGGALVYSTDQLIHGQMVSIKGAFQASLKRFWTLLGSNLIIFSGFFILFIVIALLFFIISLSVGNIFSDGTPSIFAVLPIFIGTIVSLFLVFVPGLVLIVYTVLHTPAIMLEKLGPWLGIKRSFQLIKENWWRSLGYGIVVAFLIGIFTGVFSMIGVALTFAVTMAYGPQALLESKLIIAVINSLTSIPYLITVPFTYIAITLYYYSLRSEKEGFDIEGEIEKLTEV